MGRSDAPGCEVSVKPVFIVEENHLGVKYRLNLSSLWKKISLTPSNVAEAGSYVGGCQVACFLP
eukprot:69514-Prorocentrum_minimum.AAC.2